MYVSCPNRERFIFCVFQVNIVILLFISPAKLQVIISRTFLYSCISSNGISLNIFIDGIGKAHFSNDSLLLNIMHQSQTGNKIIYINVNIIFIYTSLQFSQEWNILYHCLTPSKKKQGSLWCAAPDRQNQTKLAILLFYKTS